MRGREKAIRVWRVLVYVTKVQNSVPPLRSVHNQAEVLSSLRLTQGLRGV